MSYLGAKSSYIYTFPKPVIYRRGTEWKCPSKWLLRAYQIDRDVFPVPHGQQELDSSEIFRHKYFPHDRRTTYIMAPLFSNDCQYGMFLCELPCENYCYFELLTYQLSAAVKMIELLKQQEDSLNRLNEDNAELDNISKLDELTGLLNRRGFNKKAREALQAYSGTNKHAVIAYADMDNLKIINDKYGHNEGDYSLKALAGVLKRTFRCSDIVGRVGGDEFVAMAITDDKDFSGIIQERFRKYIDDINADSGKPYSINMSMGIYDFNCNDKLALDEAVDKADDLLYEAKKKRIKLIK